MRVIAFSIAILTASAISSSAAVLDDFETAGTSWKAADADAPYRIDSQLRIRGDAHRGAGAEQLQISAGAGSTIHFAHEFASARVVAELSASVWVKANRPGVQLEARVVLPHTADPRTGQPVATLIRGSSYSTVGMWQQLQITDTPQLVSRQVRLLRMQMGSQVDPREAYVDALYLNVYGGAGQTAVTIDDLEASGIVPRELTAPRDSILQRESVPSTGSTLTAQNFAGANPPASTGRDNFVTPTAATAAVPGGATGSPSGGAMFGGTHQVALNGSLLLVDGKPMFPRIAQSQGEPLAWFKSQGFNTVISPGPLTPQMLDEAQRVGIWLVGPPPLAGAADNPGEITLAYAPVLAWQLGANLAANDLPGVTTLAKRLREADFQLRRPLVCGAEGELLLYSRQVDILSASRSPIGSSLELKDYASWLVDRPRMARLGTPLWTTVPTEVPAAVAQQAALLAGPQSPEPQLDSDILRLSVYQAFSSGVRGIEFGSNSRLDANDNATRLRAATLAMLNLELELMEPWGAAGSYVSKATSSDPSVGGVMLGVDNARLVVVMRSPKDSQFVAAPEAAGTVLPILPGSAPIPPKQKPGDKPNGNSTGKTNKPGDRNGSGNNHLDNIATTQPGVPPANTANPGAGNPAAPPPPSGPTTLIVPGVPDSHEFYEISPTGLHPLRHRRITGGTAVAVEDFVLTTLVLVTPDPLVANAISRRAAEMAPRAAQLQREIAVLELAETEEVARRLSGNPQLPPSAATLSTVRADLQRADQLLAAGDYPRAFLAARNATLPLGRWKRETWERAVGPLTTPVTSPLAVNFNTLPDQLMFAAAIAPRQTGIATMQPASAGNQPQGPNLLPGGDFEDLQAMMQVGWRHSEHPLAEVQTAVELSPAAPYANQFCLHLQARPMKPGVSPPLIESPPVWVESAPVPLQAGDVVCIRGQVRVTGPVIGSVDGLMIYDSFAGEALAQRIGQTDGWREFVMYRAAPQAGNLVLTFALTGLGDVSIDNISVTPIRRGGMMDAPGNSAANGRFINPAQQPQGMAARGWPPPQTPPLVQSGANPYQPLFGPGTVR
ncbi:MAG TPA: hypothetical protein VGJ15_08330 [Pirellulales bacterium]